MKLEDLVIVDWLSPAAHENFNRSFVESLAGSFKQLYVFEKYLSIDSDRIIELPRPKTRWQHALLILSLISKKHADDPVLLLSYDVKYLPLFRLHYQRLLAFEHNTTPEEGALKSVLWQSMLTRRFRRLAQFPQQYERLSALKQNVQYLGSPLSRLQSRGDTQRSNPAVFLLPSARSDPLALVPFLRLFKGSTLACKVGHERFVSIALEAGVKTEVRNRLEFDEDGAAAAGVIVTVSSPIRGSGWVNDAIGHGAPIITTTESSTEIVRRTFPELKFVQLTQITSMEAFDAALCDARQQGFDQLIQANNLALKTILKEELEMIG